MNNIGKWFLVSKIDSTILCCLKAVNEKTSDGNHIVDFISFDDKYFFNKQSKNLKIIQLNRVDQIIPFDFEKSKDELNVIKWIDVSTYNEQQFQKNFKEIDIAIENTYEELDPEVDSLCKELNSYLNGAGKTIASCSGHGTNSLWIAIQFFDLKGIAQVLKLVNSTQEFKEGFVLQSIFIDNYPQYTDQTLTNPVLRLTTTCIGDPAYLLSKKLALFINTINV